MKVTNLEYNQKTEQIYSVISDRVHTIDLDKFKKYIPFQEHSFNLQDHYDLYEEIANDIYKYNPFLFAPKTYTISYLVRATGRELTYTYNNWQDGRIAWVTIQQNQHLYQLVQLNFDPNLTPSQNFNDRKW
tara:strand:- start:264 stop:656 length:393 start_codon:yes stop_codon:yes gene_type:complete